MRRLFVGIELPQEVKKNISTYLGQFPKLEKGWENESDLHVTLLFIGESTEEDYQLIRSKLRNIYFRPFEIKLTGVDFFSRRIMFVRVESSVELTNLRNNILSQLAGKFPLETKSFIPHVTIKRWQRYEFNHLEKMIRDKSFSPLTFKALKIALFESKKDLEGNKYHVLETYNKPDL